MGEQPLMVNPRFQSPFLYLQAAGSDGGDWTSKGIHLRWTLQGTLATQHIPKGDLARSDGPYPSDLHFNRADDFVRLWRAPYALDLAALTVPLVDTPQLSYSPPQVDVGGGQRVWRFGIAGPGPVEPPIFHVTLELRFADVDRYDAASAGLDPALQPEMVLQRYDGVIEVSVPGKHLLNVWIDFIDFFHDAAYTGPVAWGEAVATRDRAGDGDLYVSSHRELPPGWQSNRLAFLCEDIRYVRFRYRNSHPIVVRLQTYEDYAAAVTAANQWTPVGKFSLSLDQKVVEAALNNSPRDDVDGNWPKYNESDPGTGRFTVRTANYLDRWLRPDGLRAAVERYLDLSRFDARAMAVVTDPSTQPNGAAMDVSYQDALNIVAQDFHVARMLGLGHIDFDDRLSRTAMVYFATYVTEAPLEPFGPPGPVTHCYLTPPVTWSDYRLPHAPMLRPPRYGLWHQPVDNEPPHLLTDDKGYTHFEPVRWINLDRLTFTYEEPLRAFGSRAIGPDLCGRTLAAMYGIEYRRLGQTQWRRPEIAHDASYLDAFGLPETVTALELGKNPVYTHPQTEEGIAQFAIYAVNWFSRVSPLSNIVSTDDTRFPILRNLEPPSNFAVQLVQREDPLIFTTPDEQALLAAMPGPDRTLVRVTFEWDQVHQTAYQFADRADLFFRRELPKSVRGLVSGVSSPMPRHLVLVNTQPQTVASTSPPEVRQPFIDPPEKENWVGGNFVTDARPYVIEEVRLNDPSGNNPSFVVRQVRETETAEGVSHELITKETWRGPAPGAQKPFMAIENVGQPESWPAPLARSVHLESFHEGWRMVVHGSADNDRAYTIRATDLAGTQTRLTVREAIASSTAPLGDAVYRRRARIAGADPSTSKLRVEGDLQSGPGGLAPGMSLKVFGSPENAGTYSVSAVSVSGGETVFTIAPSPPSSVVSGYAGYEKRVPIAAVDTAARRFFLQGDLTSELAPPRVESETLADGKSVEVVIGGLTGTATVAHKPILDPNGNVVAPESGAYAIAFDSLVLPPHVDPGVSWFRGTVRILEDASNFPPTNSPSYRPPQRKVLNVWKIDTSGPALALVAFDQTFDPQSGLDPQKDPMPIATGAAVEVNFHPGYRLYLQAEAAAGFDAATILPSAGELSRKTLMAVRSADSSLPLTFSRLAPPVVLVSQELRDPLPPGVPTGPLHATRPDVYGKATYTFDCEVDAPYALVFYRGNDRVILETLYARETVARIVAELAALAPPDADFMADRWRDLVAGVVDASGRFPEYVPGGFRFPIPDNDRYALPYAQPADKVLPFDGATLPGAMIDAVRTAIEGSFQPLTEEPVIYGLLTAGTTTSPRPPSKDDRWPMAVRLPDGKVRVTDYGLDGAASSRYFYFGVELSNRMERGDRSGIAGPVLLVNSAPPAAPAIRSVTVRTADPWRKLKPAIVFTVERYLAVENVAAFRIYRTTDEASAGSVRTMELVRTVAAGGELADEFDGLDFPLYGEPLFYRIEALRRFANEQGDEELAPSWPSDVRKVSIIDDVAPPAPRLSAAFGVPLTGTEVTLPGVKLSWQRTAWRPRYHVFKMNARGNWVKVYSFASNDPLVELDLGVTELGTNVLTKRDAGGKLVYHHFKVMTENSSGILSREDVALTI